MPSIFVEDRLLPFYKAKTLIGVSTIKLLCTPAGCVYPTGHGCRRLKVIDFKWQDIDVMTYMFANDFQAMGLKLCMNVRLC